MMVLAGVLVFGTSFFIAACLLPILARIAPALGLVDRPGGRKTHGRPVPLVGGIAILASVCLPALGGIGLASACGTLEAASWIPDAISRHLPGVRQEAGRLLLVLGGAVVLLVLGALDDRRGLSPWIRLTVQVLCAVALLLGGIRVTLFIPWPLVQALVTVLFIVFVTNAVNFIDNMNGLMPGVVLIDVLLLLTLAISSGQWFMAALLLSVAGGLFAFLPRNFPRAHVFIGDAGSTGLGFLLAATAILFTYQEGRSDPLRPALIPLLLLAVPLVDGLTVVVSRLRRGLSPLTAGHDHLSHRLVARGCSPARAVIVLWALALAAGLPALLLGAAEPESIVGVWGPALLLGTFLLGRPAGEAELP